MSEQTIDLIYNITGIAGVALLVLAYFLIQIGKITSTDLIYPMLNLVGAVLHLISLNRFYNVASVIIEIFWISISLYGIVKAVKAPKTGV